MAKRPATPKEPERNSPEPEDDPGARSRAFLEERFTSLRKKSEPPSSSPVEFGPAAVDEPVSGAGLDAGAETPERTETGESAQPCPGADRHRSIKQYRKCQEKHLGESLAPAPMAITEAPPMPPAPPPVNNWIPIGPSVVRQGQGGVQPATSGRCPAIAVGPDGDRAYIGAANGGVWRTLDGGANWVSLMDAFDLNPTQSGSDSLACGAIALVAGATEAIDRIYVGSGEGAGGAE